eukprot:3471998-Amphidinium_carterae.1
MPTLPACSGEHVACLLRPARSHHGRKLRWRMLELDTACRRLPATGIDCCTCAATMIPASVQAHQDPLLPP